jgi:hypothetical protein
MKLLLITVVTIFVQLSSLLSIAKGQDVDKIAQKLIRAEEIYDDAMERYKKTVVIALKKAEGRARQLGQSQIASVEHQKDLFEKFGCTPLVCDSGVWSRRSSAHGRLVKAYQAGIRDYTRNKNDEKARLAQETLDKYWPAFLDDPHVGGWIPFGSPRIEVQDGVVSLTTARGRSGIVTKRNDLLTNSLKFELAGSRDVNAWICVQMAASRGKETGFTCHVRAEDGGVKAGFWSEKFNVVEDDGRKNPLKPLEFFAEEVRCQRDSFVMEIFVNGKLTQNVGGQTEMQNPGAAALLVESGVLFVKEASQGGVAK